MYRLKQSPRVWYDKLAQFFITLGFRALNADLIVFAKNGMTIAIYVDDILLVGASVSQVISIKKALKTRFSMSDIGASLFSLGMTVCRDRSNGILRLGQSGYLEKVQ